MSLHRHRDRGAVSNASRLSGDQDGGGSPVRLSAAAIPAATAHNEDQHDNRKTRGGSRQRESSSDSQSPAAGHCENQQTQDNEQSAWASHDRHQKPVPSDAFGSGDCQRSACSPIGGTNRRGAKSAVDARNERAGKRYAVHESADRSNREHELSRVAGYHRGGGGSCSEGKIGVGDVDGKSH